MHSGTFMIPPKPADSRGELPSHCFAISLLPVCAACAALFACHNSAHCITCGQDALKDAERITAMIKGFEARYGVSFKRTQETTNTTYAYIAREIDLPMCEDEVPDSFDSVTRPYNFIDPPKADTSYESDDECPITLRAPYSHKEQDEDTSQDMVRELLTLDLEDLAGQ